MIEAICCTLINDFEWKKFILANGKHPMSTSSRYCLFEAKEVMELFCANYNIFRLRSRKIWIFLNAASIISILLGGLLSLIRNLNECSFEECMKKIKGDFAIVYRKTGLWDTFFLIFI